MYHNFYQLVLAGSDGICSVEKKGYKLTKREFYGLLFVLFVMLLALLATYWQTNGTFTWNMTR
jgi:hypothetical protein